MVGVQKTAAEQATTDSIPEVTVQAQHEGWRYQQASGGKRDDLGSNNAASSTRGNQGSLVFRGKREVGTARRLVRQAGRQDEAG
jgi:hypothetical protein